MSASRRQVRWLWILGVIAIVHSAALVAGAVILSKPIGPIPGYAFRLWVALATLWFFWPLILALHPAQSARRTLIPLGVASAFMVLWFQFYSHRWGPYYFGLPFGVRVGSLSIARYGLSYTEGWLQAKQALRHNEVVLEGFGFGFFAPMAPRFERDEWRRFGIQSRSREGCNYNERIGGHAAGWNTATMKAICQRFPEIGKRKFASSYPWSNPAQ